MDAWGEPIDKSDWGDGPWQNEPDEMSWSFGDVLCRIVRNPHGGSLNGYISVPKSHPWYETEQDSLYDLDVHGGVTFAGRFAHSTHATPTEADLEVWWIGFDCAHSGDRSPGFEALGRQRGSPWPIFGNDTYKHIEYVRREVEMLARQAIAALRAQVDLQRLKDLYAEFAE